MFGMVKNSVPASVEEFCIALKCFYELDLVAPIGASRFKTFQLAALRGKCSKLDFRTIVWSV